MKLYRGAAFEAQDSWTGPHVATIGDTDVKLRWTQEPYVWHTNTGQEVFVVLDGVVDMHYRTADGESVITLERGDILDIGDGDEHIARPRGAARILVIEKHDSA